MSRMTDAYAAALVDGEGCVYVDKALRARVDVVMATKARVVLTSMATEYGGAVKNRSAHKAHWSDACCWTPFGTAAESFLRRIEPLLRLKGEQARLAIRAEEIRREMPRRGLGVVWTQDARDRIERIRTRLKELNHRGPTTEGWPVGAIARLVAGQWVSPQLDMFSDLGFTPFSGAWPRAGSMSNGTITPRLPSAPRTSVTGLSPLLLTPTAVLGGTSSSAWRTGYRKDPTLQGLVVMLPTPMGADGREKGGGGRWSPTSAPLEQTIKDSLRALLPTPTRQDGANVAGESQEARNSPPLNAIVRMLPTPRASERHAREATIEKGQTRGESLPGAAVRPSLEGVARLLPTPTEGDSRNSRNATANSGTGSTGHPGTTLSDVAYEWSGEPTSPPSDDGKRSTAPRRRLSSSFVEWMMGAPAGWSDPECELSASDFQHSETACR